MFYYITAYCAPHHQSKLLHEGAKGTRAPSQYPKRRLLVRSRKVSKPRDWCFELSYRFEIWQAHRQHCCRSACQMSERSDNSKCKSRGFETLRELTERRLFGYWDRAQTVSLCPIWSLLPAASCTCELLTQRCAITEHWEISVCCNGQTHPIIFGNYRKLCGHQGWFGDFSEMQIW